MAGDANPVRAYRFGDVLAMARASWVRRLGVQLDAAGYPGYRRTDAVLLRLLEHAPQPVGRLGETLGVSRQAARKFADGLAVRGYVELSADPDDGRRTMVALTAAGEAYATAVDAAADRLEKRLRRRVTPADLAVADAVLRAVFTDDERAHLVGLVARPPS